MKKLHAVFKSSTETGKSKFVLTLKTLPLLASIIAFTVLSISLINPNTNQAQAATESTESAEVNLNISEIVALSFKDCNSGELTNGNVTIDITPSYEGTFASACQKVVVSTNTPGYELLVKADDSNLTYQNPTTISPLPSIASTSATMASPAVIGNNTWGFAVEGTLSFDTSYTPNLATNKFASLPTADTTIYSVVEWPITTTEFDFYYATNLDMTIVAGDYKTNVTYTAVGEEVPEPPEPFTCPDDECIVFTVDVGTTGAYSIPTSGRVANMDNTYDWDVYIDGELTTACNNGNCTGTGSMVSGGIALTGLSDGTHQIQILPHGNNSTTTTGSIPGWGNAFGHYSNISGANIATNKRKLISLDQPLTTMAFAPKVTENATNASYMFANTFYGCENLTTPTTFISNYTLPNTITILSSFFLATHYNNTNLTTPIDLTPLTNLFSSDTAITDLYEFFRQTHYNNTNLTTPINLAPLTNLFSSNTTITRLSWFLARIHYGNVSLTTPIDLTPLENWFDHNDSINDFHQFLNGTHYNNTKLTAPIDLTPLSAWFSNNHSVSGLSNFLYQTHYGNDSLTLSNQTILPDWIKSLYNGGIAIWNTTGAFHQMFYVNSTKVGDTGEIMFEDGTTVLSSIGEPNSDRQTYTNRSGIIPLNNTNGRWK